MYNQAPRRAEEVLPRSPTSMLTEEGVREYIRCSIGEMNTNPLWMMHRGGNLLRFSAAPDVDVRRVLKEELANKLYDVWETKVSCKLWHAKCGNEQSFRVHVYADRDRMSSDIRYNVPDQYGCINYWVQ